MELLVAVIHVGDYEPATVGSLTEGKSELADVGCAHPARETADDVTDRAVGCERERTKRKGTSLSRVVTPDRVPAANRRVAVREHEAVLREEVRERDCVPRRMPSRFVFGENPPQFRRQVLSPIDGRGGGVDVAESTLQFL